MYYQDYLRLKDLKEKLSIKFDNEKRKMNQTIHIRDIFVCPEKTKESYGEFQTRRNTNKFNTIKRLISHIESLATIANAYHQKYYCNKNKNGTYSIREDSLNKITRILLNEFSLYTKKPIHINDLELLIKGAHKIAQRQQNNVHLLLSSFPVKTKDNQILNMSLYIQCGKEPKIETFCKGRCSDFDIEYDNTTNFTQQVLGRVNVSGYIASNRGQIISNNTIFSVKTMGGAEYIQAIDVCVDHEYRHSKTLMKKLANADVSSDTTVIPDQIDDILDSNSIDITKKSTITNHVVHVDPRAKITSKMKNDIMTVSELNESKMDKNMSIHRMNDGFHVQNPPFGSNYKFVVRQERKLGGFPKKLKSIIDNKNMKVKKYAWEQSIKNVNHGAEYIHFSDQANNTVVKLNAFYKTLINKCKAGFLEELFATQNYRLKLEAKNIINNSFEKFRQLQSNEANLPWFMHHVDILLGDLRINLQHINYGIPNKVSEKLISTIDKATSSIPGIKMASEENGIF